jgi:hypothetical protein
MAWEMDENRAVNTWLPMQWKEMGHFNLLIFSNHVYLPYCVSVGYLSSKTCQSARVSDM